MKYQAQHDLIDPKVPAPTMGFEFEDNDVPDPPDDAYVIGADGNSIQKLDLGAVTETQQGPHRWAKPAAFVLVALFVALSFWNAVRFVQGPPPPPKPSPFQAKQALYLGVMKIDAYRRVHGVVPDSLAEAGLPEADAYAYRRVDPAHYVLSFQGGGSKLEYDSSEPKERFFGSPKDMLTMGDSR